jgi:ornithine carrier protein
MIENAALFVGYKQVQRMIRDLSATPEQKIQYAQEHGDESLQQLSLNQLIVAGTISGAFTSLVLTPVELIKCKLQVQQHGSPSTISFRGPLHIITHTFHQNGLAGFYRGHLATFIRECGGGAFWFGSYEYICMQFMRHHESKTGKSFTKNDLAPQELMAAGALGGMAYNFSFFPFDVVKSHMQTEEELTGVKRRFGQVVKSVWQGAGIRGFYQGCGITVARSAPTSAIIFMTYVSVVQRHPLDAFIQCRTRQRFMLLTFFLFHIGITVSSFWIDYVIYCLYYHLLLYIYTSIANQKLFRSFFFLLVFSFSTLSFAIAPLSPFLSCTLSFP